MNKKLKLHNTQRVQTPDKFDHIGYSSDLVIKFDHIGYSSDLVINALLRIMPWLQLRFDYDTTTIRLRSDYDISRAPASIRRDSTRAKNEHVNFSS